jgi:adenosylcobinamide-phosphate synthase
MVPPGPALAFPAIVIAAALVVDRFIGDPHSRFHPVALIGRFIGWWGRPALYPPYLQRMAGVVFWFVTTILFAIPFLIVAGLAPWYLLLLLAPFLLKACLAWRALEDHAIAVLQALRAGTDAGQKKVRMLVSRDTTQLDREHILSAAYESVSENLTDSIVSPLFFFGIAGLAGAAVYRAANTMDAMLGYRDERVRLGWFPARMDDILNYIPARVTAFLLLLHFAARGRFTPAFSVMLRDGRNRPGFNGGIVMAAMAGGAGVRFEKPGVYTIGDPERSLGEGGGDIIMAVRAVTIMAAAIAAILATGTVLLLGTWINNIGIW